MTQSLRSTTFDLLEGHRQGSDTGNLLRGFIIALIVLNGLAVIIESNSVFYAAYPEFFRAFELFSVTIFTIEYFGRIWVATEKPQYTNMPPWRARVSFVFSPMALVDFLAIAPFYLALLIPIDLRYLRLFRLLRLLKLSHYFDGLQVFSAVLRREGGAIAGALLTMVILIVISACLMFTVENAARPGHFENVTQAIWWSVVTLTTVGYGDITPITFGGKLLAIAIMLLGVGTMALPAGILAARFSEELQNRRYLLKQRISDALEDGIIDLDEHEAIENMQRELGVSREVVERLVKQARQIAASRKFCPHCGERLEGSPT